jgi:hypothetical protein
MKTETKAPAVKLTVAILAAQIEILTARIDVLESRPTRDRGPASERQMTDADAEIILLGDHKDLSHKAAAEALGLSYGQIYSARNGFTFKTVYKAFRDSQTPAKK